MNLFAFRILYLMPNLSQMYPGNLQVYLQTWRKHHHPPILMIFPQFLEVGLFVQYIFLDAKLIFWSWILMLTWLPALLWFEASPSAGGFPEVEGETEERRKARLERHQRAKERAVCFIVFYSLIWYICCYCWKKKANNGHILNQFGIEFMWMC